MNKLVLPYLIFRRDIISRLKVSLIAKDVITDEVEDESVIDVCDLLRELLVLAEDITEKLAQQGAGDEALVGLAGEQHFDQLICHPLPVLKIVLDQLLNPLPVKSFDCHCLAELV